jgi:hypothetical protein
MDVVAREYFRSLNSMTRRIIDGQVETSDSKVQTSSEQVTPVRDESFPYRCIPFGVKIFEDADRHVWRDEHSAPFSWETQSQLNIAIRLDKSGTKPIRFQSAQHLDSHTVPLSAMLNAAKEGNLNYTYKVIKLII